MSNFNDINIDNYKKLIIDAAKRGDYDEVKSIFSYAEKLFPADVYWFKGDAMHDNEQYEEAIIFYSEALSIENWNDRVLVSRGASKRCSGKMKDAYNDYTTAILLNPNNANAWFNRGHIKKYAGDFTGALNDLTMALELGDNSAMETIVLLPRYGEKTVPYDERVKKEVLDADEFVLAMHNHLESNNRHMALEKINMAINLYPDLAYLKDIKKKHFIL